MAGKTGSICHFVFPLFYSILGFQDAQMLENQHENEVAMQAAVVHAQYS